MLCDGRSKCSTRSSNQAARPKSRGCVLLGDWQTLSRSSAFCSWRVFWMTMLNRTASTAPPDVALTETEIALLDHLMKDKGQGAPGRKTLSHYLTKVARLGGYLARAN